MNQLNRSFSIDGRQIGPGHPAYIIAEMSANHGQDLGKAIELVHAAKEAGADAIKLQTYRADTLTLKCENNFFYIKNGPWKGQYLYDLYDNAYMPWEWHARLQEVAASAGITLFSSPFDPTSVDLLQELDMPAYKIASPEIIELPLIRQAARTGKPLIISTGNATLAEINEALQAATAEGAKDICLLKCTSTYPAPPEETHLRTIPHMAESFGCPVGLSDHTLGTAVPIASVAVGACMIEKHFVLSREDETADSFFSLTPDELSEMVKAVRIAEKAVGTVNYPLHSKPAQRSLIAIADIAEGELLSHENVRSLRPGGGMLPREIDRVIGRKAARAIKRGTPLDWALVGSH
jgi:pseudaminic acid synthase